MKMTATNKTTPKKTTTPKAVIAISILVGILAVVTLAAALHFSQGVDASSSQKSEAQTSAQSQSEKQGAVKLIVYYFHGTYRCPSCTTIEQYTRETVAETFFKEVQSGRMEFRAINVEEPDNQHLIKDYKLYTKSVIVSEVVDGKEQRWKNLPKVWELLQSERTFKEYVQQEIAAYLKGKAS